jgi:hypothetical protein
MTTQTYDGETSYMVDCYNDQFFHTLSGPVWANWAPRDSIINTNINL